MRIVGGGPASFMPDYSYDPDWARVDAAGVPHLVTELPGPVSREWHGRASQHMKGYSSQVRLFPVAFERGHGVTLTDVDGNVYIDFSSGIYVTSLGHAHPKVSEAVARYAKTLMNAHDFTTPVKTLLLEKLAAITPGDLNGAQLSRFPMPSTARPSARPVSGTWTPRKDCGHPVLSGRQGHIRTVVPGVTIATTAANEPSATSAR
jgi:hypothetical protein